MPEDPGRPLKLDLIGSYPGSLEAFAHQSFVAPVHGADKTLRWRGRIGAADLQDLSNERRISRNPIGHDDAPATPGDPDHLAGDVERSWSEHRAEDADDKVEAVVGDARKVRGIPFHEAEIGQAGLLGSCI